MTEVRKMTKRVITALTAIVFAGVGVIFGPSTVLDRLKGLPAWLFGIPEDGVTYAWI